MRQNKYARVEKVRNGYLIKLRGVEAEQKNQWIASSMNAVMQILESILSEDEKEKST